MFYTLREICMVCYLQADPLFISSKSFAVSTSKNFTKEGWISYATGTGSMTNLSFFIVGDAFDTTFPAQNFTK